MTWKILNFGAIQVERDVESRGEGVYAVGYNYTVAGTYLTTVTINGVPVGTTPIGDVVVTPASVYAPACSVEGLAPKAFVEVNFSRLSHHSYLLNHTENHQFPVDSARPVRQPVQWIQRCSCRSAHHHW